MLEILRGGTSPVVKLYPSHVSCGQYRIQVGFLTLTFPHVSVGIRQKIALSTSV